MINFVYTIEDAFNVPVGEYFCVVSKEDEMKQHIVPFVNDILKYSQPDYLICTQKYGEKKYKHSSLYPQQLKYLNNINGLIIKQKNYKDIDEINEILLKVDLHFSPIEYFDYMKTPILLNQKMKLEVNSVKDFLTVIDIVVFDKIEIDVFFNNEFLEYERLLDFVKNNREWTESLLLTSQLDIGILAMIMCKLNDKQLVMNFYKENKRKILNSENYNLFISEYNKDFGYVGKV